MIAAMAPSEAQAARATCSFLESAHFDASLKPAGFSEVTQAIAKPEIMSHDAVSAQFWSCLAVISRPSATMTERYCASPMPVA